MERYLLKQPSSGQESTKRRAQQHRIEDLRKVVRLQHPKNCAELSEIERLHSVLEDGHSTADSKVEALRHLSCYNISPEYLERVRVAVTVRRLRAAPEPDVAMQLWLAGRLLALVAPSNQLQVLQVMQAAVSVKSFPNARKDPAQARQRSANCTAVAVAAIAGLSPLARRGRGASGGDDQVAEKVLQLVSAMLEDQQQDVALCRACAELIAAACCIGSDSLAVAQVRSMSSQLAGTLQEGASAEARPVLALALGCAHRAKGGMALQALVPSTASQLIAAAGRPAGTSHLWALHALWLVASAAGPGYGPLVKKTLQLCQELLVSSFGEDPTLRPAVAKLANAMVAVLGPEFTLGSSAYQRVRALVADPSAAPPPLAAAVGASRADEAPRGLETAWAGLQQVLFAQQLILFAPHAVPPRKHVPLLMSALASPRPSLRRAAAATLRHLAERSTAAVLAEGAEVALLAALDGEADGGIVTQLQAALGVLLAQGAPSAPGYWLRLLGGVALAAGRPGGGAAAGASAAAPAGAGGAPAADAAGSGAGADNDGDDDEPNGGGGGSGGADAQSAPTPAPGGGAARPALAPATPRLRTRLFAAQLLLGLFRAVGPEPRHRLLPPRDEESGSPRYAVVATGDGGGGDYLVDHLQALVDLGFKLTTGPTETLRPAGVQLLARALRFFAATPDPDLPGALLLEQYQAQAVSALRSALSPSAPPALAAAGGGLATAFLGAGLAGGDGAVMRRLMDLLTAPLTRWSQLGYPQYAEPVGVRARVALLQAHAQVALLARAQQQQQQQPGGGGRGGHGGGSGSAGAGCAGLVVRSQEPFREVLLLLWSTLLSDHALFATQQPAVYASHRSLLYGGDSNPAVVAAVEGCYAAAWPPVLDAVAAAMPGATDVLDARSAAAALGAERLHSSWHDYTDLVGSYREGGGLSRAAAAHQLRQRAHLVYESAREFALMSASEQALTLAECVSGGGATAVGAGAGEAASRLALSLRALRRLLGGSYAEAGLCEPDVLRDTAGLVSGALTEALLPLRWAALGVGGTSAAPAPGVAAALLAAAELLQEVVVAASAQGALEGDQRLMPTLLEALLVACSAVVPYCEVQEPGQPGAPPPPPVVVPVGGSGGGVVAAGGSTPRGGGTGAGADAAALSALLAAAQQLLQQSPAAQLPTVAAHLLQLGCRLVQTAPLGPQLAAAQQYTCDACFAVMRRHTQQPAAAPSLGLGGAKAAGGCLTSSSATPDAALAVAGASLALSDALRRAVGAVGGGGAAAAGSDAAAGGRLAALLAAQLATAAALCDDGGGGGLPAPIPPNVPEVVQQALAAVRGVLCCGGDAQRLRALEALRGSVQDAQAERPPGGRAALAQQALPALWPEVAVGVQGAMCGSGAVEPRGDGVAAVAEALKLLVLAANVVAARGEAAQTAVLRVLVPLLVLVAAPPGGRPVPTLREMALRLVTALPSSACGDAARAAIAALPAAAKQRLQAALREAAPPAAPGSEPAAAVAAGAQPAALAPARAATKPAIQLKMNFAIPSTPAS